MTREEQQTGSFGRYRWLLSTPSAWPDADPAALGLADPATHDVGDLLAGALHDWRGEAFLTFHRYQVFDAMFRDLVRPYELAALNHCTPDTQRAARTAFIDCARRIAMALGISQGRAEGMLQESADLMTRHPLVAQRLRDGVISLDAARKILERTDLIDAAEPGASALGGDEPTDQAPTPMEAVDAAIAAELDRGAGAWSIHLVRDLADRIVFRAQPDAVRARREASKRDRRVWTANRGDDMGLIAATMTGERIRISMESVLSLAKSVCPNDPRTLPQRNSDAVFALLNQLPFECACEDRHRSTAKVADSGAAIVPVKTKLVVHVVADKATVDRRERNPGFMDGHGVISGDHVHDLLDDPTTIVRPLGPDDELAAFLHEVNRAADDPSDVALATVDSGDVRIETDIASDAVDSANAPTQISSATVDSDVTPVTNTPKNPPSDPPSPMNRPASAERGRATRQPEPTDARTTHADRPTGLGAEIVLPGTQPHNPYRPSTALDTFVRIRDCYTLIPGNPHSSFHCDLDHWTEFNHDDPSAGGRTEPENLGAKDRFAHNRKTHGDWVDDLVVDPDGHVRPVFITPGRLVIEGRAGPGLDLFPGLARYRFTPPEASGRQQPGRQQPGHRKPGARQQCRSSTPSTPLRTRTADKHARRRVERELNRAARQAGGCTEPPAVRAIIASDLADAALGDPPF